MENGEGRMEKGEGRREKGEGWLQGDERINLEIQKA